MNQVDGKERIKPLDGLRAFAILLVMFSHAIWEFSKTDLHISAPFENIFHNGFSGVNLFFVLSGFLITSQLIKRPINKQTLKAFFARRFFRIAPAYYVSVTLFVLLFLIVPMLAQHDAGDVFGLWAGPYFSHLIFNQDYLFSQPHIAAAYWTIPVEIRFYLLCPFFIWGLARIKNQSAQVILIALMFCLYVAVKIMAVKELHGLQEMDLVSYFWSVKVKFHFALESLMAGFLCAYLFHHKNWADFFQRRTVADRCFLLGLAGFLSLTVPSAHYGQDMVTVFEQVFLPSGFALSYGLLVFGAVNGSFAAPYLSGRFLKFIAEISYSLYLVHIFMLSGFITTVFAKMMALTGSYTVSWLAMLPVYFAVCACLAYMLHSFVEKPCMAWSKKRWKMP